jgi:hypothetical protein
MMKQHFVPKVSILMEQHFAHQLVDVAKEQFA